MSTSLFTIDDIKDALSVNKWGGGISWGVNNSTEYLTFDYSGMTDEQKANVKTASKVINSKVLGENDELLMNWNTALFTNNNNSDMNSIFNGGYDANLGAYRDDIPITEWDSDLSSLTNGQCMFKYCTNLASFDSDLSSLTYGEYMFQGCSSLTTFDSDLSSLTDGYCMFAYSTNLASFDSDLPSLTYGNGMFVGCTALTECDADLSSLTYGDWMFNDTKLTSFESNLSSLTSGNTMFNSCSNLTSFNSDLSSLTYGDHMFYYCSKLAAFNSNLSSLTDGWYMFYNCKLDTTSVKNIADTINAVSSGNIHIGIGNTTPNTEESSAFNTMVSKGWTVYVNGSSTAWTLTASTNLTDEEEQSTPIPFYAKYIQVTEDEAEYVDSNNNYYNIVGAQFIYGDNISTYGQFTSHEHAVEEISLSLGLTKYVKPTEEKVQ